MSRIACFGETLLDLFIDQKKIGGAPLNVASRIQSLGNEVSLISRIGNDQYGKKILTYLNERQLSTGNIQIDQHFPTGTVQVTLDNSGTATYVIAAPAAWDQIEADPESLLVVKNSDALIYGSLACRNEQSKQTLFQFLKLAKFKIFDVNLRPPHYNMDLILRLLKKADFIKLNDEELEVITKLIGIPALSAEDQIRELSNFTGVQLICLTLGKNGALLLKNDNIFKNKGYVVSVKDTVGAGDSFLASLIHSILQNAAPQESLNRACAIGSLVASKNGANPIITNIDISKLINSQNTDH